MSGVAASNILPAGYYAGGAVGDRSNRANIPTGRVVVGGIGGNDATHNFRNEVANTPRLVLVDVNRSGFARLFNFIPSFHEANNDGFIQPCRSEKTAANGIRVP